MRWREVCDLLWARDRRAERSLDGFDAVFGRIEEEMRAAVLVEERRCAVRVLRREVKAETGVEAMELAT